MELQDDYVPVVNNFSFLKKGEGLGKNMLQNKRNVLMKPLGSHTNSKHTFDNLDVLYRTFTG